MPHNQPIPANEFERLLELSDLDLDYSDLKENFKDLLKLAARVAGADISLVNLIDSFTQWTVANHGLPIEQMPREESVCQYTIMENEPFEVKDLKLDPRFRDKPYVAGGPMLSYYFGVPLTTKKGIHIGALCVMDQEAKVLSPEKVEMLRIIADEIVNRLMILKLMNSLTHDLHEAKEMKKRVAHDIRGPIGGIIGLADLVNKRGESNKLDEVLEFIRMIQKSSTSLLELADEILNAEVKAAAKQPELKEHELNLLVFKDKLEKLYLPQAKNKSVNFVVNIDPKNGVAPFPKNKLLQITGNLISNAIKFTPANGTVTVDLDLLLESQSKTLHIKVSDTGIGLDQEKLKSILSGQGTSSTEGTKGEQGYGFGLPLVKYLIDTLKGKLDIHSTNAGTTFEVKLPVQG